MGYCVINENAIPTLRVGCLENAWWALYSHITHYPMRYSLYNNWFCACLENPKCWDRVTFLHFIQGNVLTPTLSGLNEMRKDQETKQFKMTLSRYMTRRKPWTETGEKKNVKNNSPLTFIYKHTSAINMFKFY